MNRAIFLTVLAIFLSGCYRTFAVAGVSHGEVYTHHQWFTLAGATRISGDVGQECKYGIAEIASKEDLQSILLGSVLSGAGFVLAAHVCQDAVCYVGIGTAAPALLATRRVEYTCRDAPTQDASVSSARQ